jgi:hypothetical protein
LLGLKTTWWVWLYINILIVIKYKEMTFTIFARSLTVSLITLMYVGFAFKNAGRPSSVPFELIAIFVPIFYGLFGMFDASLTAKFGGNYSLLVGAMVGLVFSLFGHFAMDLPKDIFKFTSRESAHIVHLYAILLYSVIFRFIVHPLNH